MPTTVKLNGSAKIESNPNVAISIESDSESQMPLIKLILVIRSTAAIAG